ncbi:hybrid sensor histidine kinase/response regulator transcription factor [Aquimarina sp. 2201CG14-23]|uniref:hybrid sensor histidine kinase/response regulator transcription factor n=1 Tax=Aquimarina mycalae TaxID=3040073 RepID=UPI00247828BD|nr:two-component regulator propeller domain-containing protein [Aquimarina sp. 2201CG14-23]MDH7446258.1 response regulator [Aquimarina sp. 2201CG14-23]
MKCIHKLIVFFACFLLSYFDISGQADVTYNVKSYNVFNGLSNNWVSNIFQDKDGFIWFATQYGLNRFDGQKFKIYTYVPGDTEALRANWIRSITQIDNDHKLYLGTLGGGVNVLDPYQEIFSQLFVNADTTDYNMANINNLVSDHKENIWISSTVGVFRYQPKDSTIKRFYDNTSSNISISENGSKRILVKHSKEIYDIVNDTIQKINLLKGKQFRNIYTVSRDSMLVYTNEELILAYKSDSIWQLKKLDFETKYTTSVRERPFIFKDKDEYIWINAGDKIYKFSPNLGQSSVIPIKDLLNSKSSKNIKANCMFQDQEDNYWIGTNLGAFQLIPHKPLRHPFLGNIGKAREIVECGNKIWYALSDGIYSWDKNPDNPPKKVRKSIVTSMICASDTFLYTMGKDDNNELGLLKINPETNITTPIYFPELEFPLGVSWRIIEDKNQRLWIAQWDNIIIYSLKDQDNFSIPVFKENTGIIELYNDNQDNVWLGSIGKGLLKFSKASTITADNTYEYKQYLHDINDPKSISSNLIQTIHQDHKGVLWIGTDGGLNNLDINTEKFQRFLRNDQMPNDKILNIISDKNGVIWLSTVSHGIISYHPKTKKFTIYNVKDGLFDNSMVLSSVYQNKEGFIWIGSEGGVQYFHPDQLTSTIDDAPNLTWLSFTKYKADTTVVEKFPNKRDIKQDQIKVYPEDQNISLHFQTLTFERPENVRYQFWLQGFHEDWLPIQEKGLITLSYLPKGNYTLHVKASSSEDTWEIIHNPIAVIVLPPWYKTNVAYVMYSLFLFLLMYIFYKIQLRRRVAETEKEYVSNLAQVKTRWFNQIAHEFRTPLTVILGAVDQIRTKSVNNNQSKENKHLNQIEDQANHLSNQVHQILEIAQMQDDQIEVDEQMGDFISFQRYLLYSFNSLAEEKEISLTFSSVPEELNMYFDEDKWRKITTNLVSNAIKYNVVGGTVSLQIKYTENKENSVINVIIKDSGIGISSDFLKILYDPFTRSQTAQEKGVGLGLTLTKELVELMQGDITVESEKGIGTTFSIRIPVTISPDFQDSDKGLDSQDSSLPIVLVAEDHKEVQEYIQFCLASSYKVLLASNGQHAWELCQEHLPDLVISDIMMPKWDGIKLGTMIKDHIATDHIPLIFLTAKANQNSQIEGLKIGADAYLAKPFDREELLIRVNHLIQTRRKLREKYDREDVVSISENKAIDSFMQSVIDIVKDHMDNDEFSIPLLAERLHMSRVHLFRKIKNLTGMSPTKFIRKIRLQHARDLLNNKEFSIAEIAYQTGFKDPAYFTRVYVEEFGKPPSESRK